MAPEGIAVGHIDWVMHGFRLISSNPCTISRRLKNQEDEHKTRRRTVFTAAGPQDPAAGKQLLQGTAIPCRHAPSSSP